MPLLIEACVDTIRSAIAAQLGGADRIELCDNLAEGGTTPSHGTIGMAVEHLTIPVFPIIRPRAGSFVYDDHEVEVMRRDVKHARWLGAHGVVVGALTTDGAIDERVVRVLQDAAKDIPVTFHRAFDVCRDPMAALETLVSLGVTRVLTSGQRATAWEGRQLLAELRRQAEGRITIVAGGGVDESNAAGLVRETGVTELHVRGTMPFREVVAFHDQPVPFRRPAGEDEGTRFVTDPIRIGAIRAAANAGSS